MVLAQAGVPTLEGSDRSVACHDGLAPDMQGLLDQRGVAKDLQAVNVIKENVNIPMRCRL